MDIIIIGSGPAGISAALYAKRAGADVTVISRGSGALAKAEKIENYYGLAEPVTGAELEANGIAGAKRLGVNFIEDEVVGVAMNDDFTGLVVQTPNRTCEAKAVVLSAGSTRLAGAEDSGAERTGRKRCKLLCYLRCIFLSPENRGSFGRRGICLARSGNIAASCQ